MIIAGTMPIEGLELTKGEAKLEGSELIINNKKFPVSIGTGALIGAVVKTLEYFEEKPPMVVTAGDIGDGSGSLKIYEELKNIDDDLVVIHYIKPKISCIKEIDFSPKVIADAGGMYAGKAAGIGNKFHCFFQMQGSSHF